VTGRRGNPTADRLVEAAKTAHTELGEVVLDLAQLQRRLAVVRSQLGYAVTMYDSGAVIETAGRGRGAMSRPTLTIGT
jgi:hypothetical protein